MQIPDFFLGYIITGGVSIIWLLPLISILKLEIPEIDTVFTLYILPLLYIQGILLDTLATLVLDKSKSNIKKEIATKTGLKHPYSYYVEITLIMNGEAFLKTQEKRTTRFKIARGAFINIVLATLVIPTFFLIAHRYNEAIIFLIICIIFCVISFRTWKISQYASYQYGYKLAQELKKREEKMNKNDTPSENNSP